MNNKLKNHKKHSSTVNEQKTAKRHMFTKIIFPKLTMLFLFISTILFVLHLYLKQNLKTNIGVSLTSFGDISLSYFSDQYTSISPLCGCEKELEGNRWRGISFIASHFELLNSINDIALPAYFITSPFPTTINWTPFIAYDVRLYKIGLPYGETLSISKVVGNEYPKSYYLLTRNLESQFGIFLFTEGNIDVGLYSSTPLGCILPVKESKIKILQTASMFASGAQVTTIEENYPSLEIEDPIQSDSGTIIKTYPGVPIVDVLGPEIFIWSYSNALVATTNDIEKGIGIKEILDSETYSLSSTNQVITVLQVKPIYSARIACMQFITRDFQTPKLTDIIKHNVTPFARSSGKTTIRIYEPIAQSSIYEDFYPKIKKNDQIFGRNLKLYTYDHASFEWMSFRMPPIPPSRGLNIFGKIEELSFSGAVGSLVSGMNSFGLGAPTKIEFKKIDSLFTDRNIIQIPHKYDVSDNKSLSLQAKCELYINGESINKRLNKNKYLFSYLTLTISLLSLIVAFSNYLLNLRKNLA